MALASSGSISIGGSTSGRSINLELGRSATASSNLNESALRSLAQRSSGSISLSDFHGKSNALDTQTVTVGYLPGNSYFATSYGYNSFFSYGSISDGTLNPLQNKPIINLTWNDTNTVILSVSSYYYNSGFTTMNIAGTSFNRTSATYVGSSSGSNWQWANSTTNPFGTTVGATKTVVFT
jgi:hypothetical protein